MSNDTHMIIISVIILSNKILLNTNYYGAIHLKVICFEHSFEIIHRVIHTFPEYSSSIYHCVGSGTS